MAMNRRLLATLCFLFSLTLAGGINAQNGTAEPTEGSHTLYDIAPRALIDFPTAGTLPRGSYQIGLRLFSGGGAIGYTDIGLSNRFMLGISYGGTQIVSSDDPRWNPRIGFSLKFRIIDEMEWFPAVAVGFSDQGNGVFRPDSDRYTYKACGFYAVASRGFYFYKWTSGWHFGVNYSLEDEGDGDSDVNLFGGFDATFNYNVALAMEYDAAINDNSGEHPEVSGQGRGYLNMSVKWLFAENLELELLLKDLLVNRRESSTLTREVRMMYIDHF